MYSIMRSKLIILLLFAFLLSLQSAEAIGLAHGPLRHDFEPGKEIEVSFRVVAYDNPNNVNIQLGGDLLEYGKMTNIDDSLSFTVTLTLPDEHLEPGEHMLTVMAHESSDAVGSIGVDTKVVNPIRIFVPYEGKYLRVESFGARDVAVGEYGHFNIKVKSLGESRINSVQAQIDIYDNSTDELVKTIHTNTISLVSGGSGELIANWNDLPDKSGIYRAEATINFDDKSMKREQNFHIGELLVEISGFSEQLEQLKAAPFDVTVESKWNSDLKSVYASIIIDGTEFKSYPTDLPPWQSHNVTAYIDASELEIGESYPVNITIHYADKTSNVEGNVEVIPPEDSVDFRLNSTNVTYLFIAIALIVAIYTLHKLNINISIKKKK
jgi:hypothetical protein